MPVSLWAVLAIVLILMGFTLLIALPEAAYAIGAGFAFLVVALVEWRLDRNRDDTDPDLPSR